MLLERNLGPFGASLSEFRSESRFEVFRGSCLGGPVIVGTALASEEGDAAANGRICGCVDLELCKDPSFTTED